MTTQQEMVFDDLTPVEVPVKINGKAYILREASAGAAVKWQNFSMKSAKMSDGKIVGMEGAADAQPYLVSLCLLEVTADGLKPVPVPTILSWKSKILKDLFNKAKEISDLDEADNPQRKAVVAALARTDCPIDVNGFRTWANKLAEEDSTLFKPLVDLIKPETGDQLKNA